MGGIDKIKADSVQTKQQTTQGQKLEFKKQSRFGQVLSTVKSWAKENFGYEATHRREMKRDPLRWAKLYLKKSYPGYISPSLLREFFAFIKDKPEIRERVLAIMNAKALADLTNEFAAEYNRSTFTLSVTDPEVKELMSSGKYYVTRRGDKLLFEDKKAYGNMVAEREVNDYFASGKFSPFAQESAEGLTTLCDTASWVTVIGIPFKLGKRSLEAKISEKAADYEPENLRGDFIKYNLGGIDGAGYGTALTLNGLGEYVTMPVYLLRDVVQYEGNPVKFIGDIAHQVKESWDSGNPFLATLHTTSTAQVAAIIAGLPFTAKSVSTEIASARGSLASLTQTLGKAKQTLARVGRQSPELVTEPGGVRIPANDVFPESARTKRAALKIEAEEAGFNNADQSIGNAFEILGITESLEEVISVIRTHIGQSNLSRSVKSEIMIWYTVPEEFLPELAFVYSQIKRGKSIEHILSIDTLLIDWRELLIEISRETDPRVREELMEIPEVRESFELEKANPAIESLDIAIERISEVNREIGKVLRQSEESSQDPGLRSDHTRRAANGERMNQAFRRALRQGEESRRESGSISGRAKRVADRAETETRGIQEPKSSLPGYLTSKIGEWCNFAFYFREQLKLIYKELETVKGAKETEQVRLSLKNELERLDKLITEAESSTPIIEASLKSVEEICRKSEVGLCPPDVINIRSLIEKGQYNEASNCVQVKIAETEWLLEKISPQRASSRSVESPVKTESEVPGSTELNIISSIILERLVLEKLKGSDKLLKLSAKYRSETLERLITRWCEKPNIYREELRLISEDPAFKEGKGLEETELIKGIIAQELSPELEPLFEKFRANKLTDEGRLEELKTRVVEGSLSRVALRTIDYLIEMGELVEAKNYLMYARMGSVNEVGEAMLFRLQKLKNLLAKDTIRCLDELIVRFERTKPEITEALGRLKEKQAREEDTFNPREVVELKELLEEGKFIEALELVEKKADEAGFSEKN